MSDNLALFGGMPIRQSPYPIHDSMINEEEEKEAIEVLRGKHLSGFSAKPGERFLGGPKVKEFEQSLKDYFGVKHAISFNSATTALHGIVNAAGVGPGDEVIVPSTTMSATATAVVMQFAVPVFADIEDETFGLDPAAVERAITDRTKAILAVNLFGHPARLKELRMIAERHKLILLEDNAQSPGAFAEGQKTGTIGLMGVQSFNYHKGCQTGEGGAVLTNDDRCARHLQLLRNHGEVVIDHFEHSDADLVNMVGSNYRLTELQAAVGIPQMRKLDHLNKIRRDLAARLSEGLLSYDFLKTPIIRENCTHSFYLYALRYSAEILGTKRSTFAKAMKAEGVSLTEGYVRPIYLEPMYQKKIAYGKKGMQFRKPIYDGDVSYSAGICPIAEKLWKEQLLVTDICKFPLGEKEVDEFLMAVEKIVHNIDSLRKYEARES